MEEKVWNIFNGKGEPLNLGAYAILVLNRPINIPLDTICTLWNGACWRMTVDGGTDRWFDFVKQHSLSLPLPNYVSGDFDSVRAETLKFCKEHDEITLMDTPNQDRTDFHKALNILISDCPHKLDCYVAIAEHSGRLDHTFSNLNALSRVSLQGYIISQKSLTWLLYQGKNKILIPDYLFNKWCGILPFSQPAKITTQGLKWDMTERCVQFGGLISSSNSLKSPVIIIESDAVVIWTMSTNNS